VTRVAPENPFPIRRILSPSVKAWDKSHRSQPRSGARIKPTAQAVAQSDKRASPIGAKDVFLNASILIMLAIVLLFDASCNRRPADAFFPASNEVPGWVKTGDTRTFEAADLWKYIDGEAERYLKVGVQRVFTSDYEYRNEIDAAIDIYIMKSTEGSKRIFELDPAADARPVQLGDGARLYSQSVIFRKGIYLIRIVAYQESAETPQALFQLGQAIEGRVTR